MGFLRRYVFFMIAVVAGAWLEGLFPASAGAPATVPVTDPHRIFTIRVPADWAIQWPPTTAQERFVSIMIASSHDRAASVMVVVKRLDKPLPPSALTRELFLKHDDVVTETIVQEGQTHVAGREAYYQYHIVQHQGSSPDAYLVKVYMSDGRLGFIIMGTARYDRRDTDLPLLLQIIESLRPT